MGVGREIPRKRTIVTVAVLTLFTLGGVIRAETQSFDTEAGASRAGWTEFGSRINNFDFGYSSTNNAEGTARGEGGGTIARSQPLGYYGDVTIGSITDLSKDLHATGRIKFQDNAYDGEFFFGYFDRDQAEANNIDYIGIHVFEPRNGLWRINSSINGVFPGDVGIDGDRLNIPDDTALNFEIDWDADGGAAGGDGKLTLTFTTLDGSQTFVSTVEGSDDMTVNAFGLLNRPQSGNAGQIGDFWFDDLTYTSGTGPGAQLNVTYDGSTPGAETLSVSWKSAAGKLYNLRSETAPASAEPIAWPTFGGNMDLVATPPENTVIIPFPGDPLRLFVVEEFDAPPLSIFLEDFESGQGAWTTASTGAVGTEWELGAPDSGVFGGPPAANSGTNCFGTDLDANYREDTLISLRSPEIDLTTAGGATLNFFQFMDIEVMFDAGIINVLDAADDSFIAEVDSGIDGSTTTWEPFSKKLPPEALGKRIKIEFLFDSDNFGNQAGWYIDDVEVTVP